MRGFANVVSWAVLVGLAGLAVLFVARLGFVGLMILGLATLLVCSRMVSSEDVPTWGEHVFRARMEGRATRPGGDVRFFQWCGVVLLLVGVAGFVWQRWSGGG